MEKKRTPRDWYVHFPLDFNIISDGNEITAELGRPNGWYTYYGRPILETALKIHQPLFFADMDEWSVCWTNRDYRSNENINQMYIGDPVDNYSRYFHLLSKDYASWKIEGTMFENISFNVYQYLSGHEDKFLPIQVVYRKGYGIDIFFNGFLAGHADELTGITTPSRLCIAGDLTGVNTSVQYWGHLEVFNRAVSLEEIAVWKYNSDIPNGWMAFEPIASGIVLNLKNNVELARSISSYLYPTVDIVIKKRSAEFNGVSSVIPYITNEENYSDANFTNATNYMLEISFKPYEIHRKQILWESLRIADPRGSNYRFNTFKGQLYITKDNKMRFTITPMHSQRYDSVDMEIPVDIKVGEWNHIIIAKNIDFFDGWVRAYFNGRLKKQVRYTNETDIDLGDNRFIGGAWNERFKGEMSDVIELNYYCDEVSALREFRKYDRYAMRAYLTPSLTIGKAKVIYDYYRNCKTKLSIGVALNSKWKAVSKMKATLSSNITIKEKAVMHLGSELSCVAINGRTLGHRRTVSGVFEPEHIISTPFYTNSLNQVVFQTTIKNKEIKLLSNGSAWVELDEREFILDLYFRDEEVTLLFNDETTKVVRFNKSKNTHFKEISEGIRVYVDELYFIEI